MKRQRIITSVTTDGSETNATGRATAEPRRGPGRPRREDVEARREEILAAAVRLFAEHGFSGTTIEAVATAVGATKRTVYRHFTDKTGLFFAAVDRLHVHERPPVRDGEDLEELATRMVHILHGDDAITLHRLVVAESLRHPQLAADFYAKGPARSIAVLTAGLEVEHGAGAGERGEMLYTLLLGEAHRKRLLGLTAAPSREEARAYARRAIGAVVGVRPGR